MAMHWWGSVLFYFFISLSPLPVCVLENLLQLCGEGKNPPLHPAQVVM